MIKLCDLSIHTVVTFVSFSFQARARYWNSTADGRCRRQVLDINHFEIFFLSQIGMTMSLLRFLSQGEMKSLTSKPPHWWLTKPQRYKEADETAAWFKNTLCCEIKSRQKCVVDHTGYVALADGDYRPPHFISKPTVYKVKVGSSITLSCEAVNLGE